MHNLRKQTYIRLQKKSICTYCKILYYKSNCCIAIYFVCAYNITIANIY